MNNPTLLQQGPGQRDVEAIVARHHMETELERRLWRYGPPAWAAGLTRREVVQRLRAMLPVKETR